MSPTASPRSKIFGVVLQDLRRSRGLSQEALANDCGVDRTSISLWERGRHSPKLDSLFALAVALEVSASEIIRRIEAAEV